MKQLMSGIVLVSLLALPAAVPAAPKADRLTQVQEPQVQVIGLIGDRAILRINGQQAILRRDETRDGVTLLGVSNGEALLRIGKRELRLGMGMDTGGIAERAGGASVEIVMNGIGQFITNGTINGRVVEFLVDTGANTVSMTTADAQRLGIDYRVEGTPASSATAGGVVKSWMVRLRSVQVGPITVKNVVASVRESPLNDPILLGMTFLNQISMQQENNRLKLTAR